jgi:FixJ family two-component response regulator
MSDQRILLVEDDEGMRLAVERLLFARGYPVTAFASGEDLLGSAAREKASCLILDVRLPGISGPELRERLAAEGVTAPVILMTAHDDPRTRDRARAAHPVAYLHKPFEGRQLLEAVARALSLSRDERGRTDLPK